MTRTLAVCCPDWPVVAAGRQGAIEPVAIVFANRVVACSEAARADGVAPGLRRREAQSRCPEIEILPWDQTGEARAFEPVVAAVATFTPRVEVVDPGTCAFATRGPSRYFGGDGALAARVAAVVDGVLPAGAPRCLVGVADGPFAARLAARTAGVAAGDVAPGRPRRWQVVAPGRSRAWLAPLPVDCLDHPELADLWQRLGVRTLGDLAALPAADVLSRFGPEGAAAFRLACGQDGRPLAAADPPPELVVQTELDPPALRVDTAAFVAKGLAGELLERLQVRGLACTRVRIEVETEHGESLSRLWRHEGALSAPAIAERARWQLEGWLASGATTAGITLVRLAPDEVGPDAGRQLGFWGGSAAADERAARALARVQGLLGPTGVVTAVIDGGRGPGERVRLVPWGDPRQPEGATRHTGRAMRGTRLEEPPWPGQVPAPAPALVHDPPLPAAVANGRGELVRVSARGELSDRPARLAVGGRAEQDLVAWAGPWTAEERWWDRTAHRRRARLQVLTAAGEAYLLVLEGGRWMLEATYD
jgi:protein ImuB